uniref:Uncharacterized protein n=1 Tax=Solanum tuberosum TaxID=4113 RepID=M1AKB0_SOLTU
MRRITKLGIHQGKSNSWELTSYNITLAKSTYHYPVFRSICPKVAQNGTKDLVSSPLLSCSDSPKMLPHLCQILQSDTHPSNSPSNIAPLNSLPHWNYLLCFLGISTT